MDTVVITKDLVASGIVAGDIGVVAHLYAGNSVAEVEFVSGAGHGLRPLLAHASGEGTTLAVETLPISNIRPVGAREILHARSLETA